MIGWFAALAWSQDAEIEVVGRSDPGPTEVRVDAVARPGDGLEDVLATVPGVQIRRLGGLGAFAGISLRGTGFRQSLIRLDGIPLNPDGVAAVDLSRLPLAGIDLVRVTRGRPPATVGAAPIGGVVDLQTSTGASFTRAEVAGGRFGAWRLAGALARGATRAVGPDVDGLLAVDGLTTHGRFTYLDDGGTRFVPDDDRFVERQNNDRQQGAVLGRMRLTEGPRTWTGLVSGVVREEGLPGPIGQPLDGVRLTTGRALVALGSRRTRASSDRALQGYAIVRRERLRDPEGALGRVDGAQRDRFDTVGGQLSGERGPVRGSVAGRHEGFGRRVDSERIVHARRIAGAAAIDVPLRSGPVVVTPGLDVRGLMSIVPEAAATGALLPGATAVFYGDRPVSAHASVTSGFRPPDLTELYGDRGSLVGNPDLRPERADKAEVGVRAGATGTTTVRGSAAVGVAWARDAIGWLQNTQRTVIAVNFGRTRTWSAELGVGIASGERFGLDTSFTLLQAIQTTDDPSRNGRPVPFVAPVRSWSRAFVRPLVPLTLSVDVAHQSAMPIAADGVTIQPPRTLVGAWLGLALRSWTLSLRVDNVLDTRTSRVPRDPRGFDDTQIDAPVTDFVGYPLPGRTWLVGLRFDAPRRRP